MTLTPHEPAGPTDAAGSAAGTTAPPCWALAMGGTRRGYIAQGGVLASAADLAAYMRWAAAAQQSLLDRVYDLGISTIIAIIRIPTDRGDDYKQLAIQSLVDLVDNPRRQVWYDERRLRVTVAGGVHQLASALQAPTLAERLAELPAMTQAHTGPTLVYLLRGAWVEAAAEEALVGYQLGQQLGRAPTRRELVQLFYTYDIPPLTVYVGSGRPQVLPVPFLRGGEHSYWSQTPLMHLERADWERILADHRGARQTKSSRAYPSAPAQLARLQEALNQRPPTILGLGQQHPEFGFWTPLPQ